MKCDCGAKVDFLSAKVVVDTLEKEYYCLTCTKSIFLVKSKNGDRALKNRDGSVISSWKV